MKAIVTFKDGTTKKVLGSLPKAVTFFRVEFFSPVMNEDLALLSVAMISGGEVWAEDDGIRNSENFLRLFFFACRGWNGGLTYENYKTWKNNDN